MTRIAFATLLTAFAAAPALALEPLQVTVSDHRVPAFLLQLDAELSASDADLTVVRSARNQTAPDSADRAAIIFAQLAEESRGGR